MYYLLSLLSILILPGGVLRAAAPTDFAGLVDVFLDIISVLVPVIFVLTFIVLIWGVIKGWIIQGGNTEGVEQGKRLVVVGIIALVVMAGIWGILAILKNTFFGGI